MTQWRIFRKDRPERHRLVFQGRTTITPAKEWHSTALWFRRGDRVSFVARSELKIFARFHGARKYTDQMQSPGAYAVFWRSGSATEIQQKIRQNGLYYAVLRNSRFGDRAEVEIHVTVDEPILEDGGPWNVSPSMWDSPLQFSSAGTIWNPTGWTGRPWARNDTIWVVVGIISFFLTLGNLLVLFGLGGQALLLAIEADGSIGGVMVAMLLFLSKGEGTGGGRENESG